MVISPVLSPRPNPPGPGMRALSTKTKTLAILNSSNAQTATAASTPGDPGRDLAEQMNDEVRKRFITGSKLGEGTYAIVYSGHYREDPSSLVAIKKIKVNQDYKDGIAMDAIREIKFLSELEHPNVIKLHAVFSTKDQNISLVLEHLPLGDLETLWKTHTISYTSADIKAWANMLAQAVWFCHENFILHRDIKGNNLLIAADGTVKLADFGLARSFADPGRIMTYNVITRFYRPPELLLGARHYGGGVDVWSMGVVIAELAIREWFLPSETDFQQLCIIYDVFGTPTEETWPGVSQFQFYTAPDNTPAPSLTLNSSAANGNPSQNTSQPGLKRAQPLGYWRNRFPLLGEDGIDLIRGMLTLDPLKRLSARAVLDHRYWTNAPRPTKKEDLPRQGGGEQKMGEDLKRRGGEVDTGRADKVARRLDFSAVRK
ncbi:serine/threonine-protein kinase-like protein [Lindgomyces ingoldianus]|uniref:Serine/threonine-protein kinase-like protein n=1 Tax=Lindgomyces ingoldianus TaxID=673940 RepID=A0ACB6R7P8_9PLEO|nr:serine/threonine-protein kinase-like protein [Lindgomyces ingoldianus]KAF2474486.1 serine/threonine-protein kinase-like protein [Lindgomyces ingoldianus]